MLRGRGALLGEGIASPSLVSKRRSLENRLGSYSVPILPSPHCFATDPVTFSQVLKKKSLGNAKRPRKLFLCSLRALSMPGRQYQALPSVFLGDHETSARYSSIRDTKMPHSVSECVTQGAKSLLCSYWDSSQYNPSCPSYRPHTGCPGPFCPNIGWETYVLL